MFLFNVHNIEIFYKRLDYKTKPGNLVVTDPLGVRKVLLGVRKVLLGVRKVPMYQEDINRRPDHKPPHILPQPFARRRKKKLLNIPSAQLYLHFCIYANLEKFW